MPPGVTKAELQSSLEVASQLAIMVGRRAELERERRLGSFLIELSRWLLATPDRDLLLRYTMQSLMSLVGAEGSYVALREPHSDELRVVIALGMAEDKKGMTLPLAASTTGRVVQSGQPLVTANIFAEPDAYPPGVMEKMRRFVAGSQLHLNRGGLKFEQAGARLRVDAVGWAYGACLADLDSDGWLDLYATCGFASRSRSEPDG